MKRVLWLAVSVLMALSLVLAGCAPAAPEEQEKKVTVTEKEETTKTEVVAEKEAEKPAVSAETPQYGGILNVAITSEPTAKGSWGVYEQFMGQDWTRGPAGEGITQFSAGSAAMEDSMMPILTESWEIPEIGVWVMQVRRGVHWQQTGTPAARITNGREMTADDIVDSFNWQLRENPRSWIHVGQPAIAEASSIEKTGPWEITVRTPVDYLTSWTWLVQGAGYHRVYPVDVAKAFGHELMWRGEGWDYREAVGTGPFWVEEVIAGSLIRWKRNPNYWDTDRVGPGKGNQLPYIDGYTQFSIPDRSTQLAALRTGKVDVISGLTRDDWEQEMRLSPRLQWNSYLHQTSQNRFISMRLDKKELPFADIRVRHAMMMATDFEAIKNGYYGGAAEIDIWPLNSNFKETGYVPLDQMPENVQELYRYNPERAKQLLKEAGYPNGFKTSIVVSGSGMNVDEVAIFKDMWAKVGIEMALDIREGGAFSNVDDQGAFPELLYRFQYTTWPMMFYFSPTRGVSTNNLSSINNPERGTADPVIEKAFQDINDNMVINMPEVYRLMRELRPYLMYQAHTIPRPQPYTYNVWQPWLKNYYGSTNTRYHWIDRDLKKSLGF